VNRSTAYSCKWPKRAPALLFFLSLFFFHRSAAQEKTIVQLRITITLKDRPFPEALAVIESKIPFQFAYSTDLVRQQKNVSVKVVDMPLSDLLAIVLQGTSLTYHVIGRQIVLQPVTAPANIRVVRATNRNIRRASPRAVSPAGPPRPFELRHTTGGPDRCRCHLYKKRRPPETGCPAEQLSAALKRPIKRQAPVRQRATGALSAVQASGRGGKVRGFTGRTPARRAR